jgi:hypothetical protein
LAVHLAIENGPTGLERFFYIFEDDRDRAELLLRATFQHLGGNVRIFGPLGNAVASALNLSPGAVVEWYLGSPIIVSLV